MRRLAVRKARAHRLTGIERWCVHCLDWTIPKFLKHHECRACGRRYEGWDVH